MIFTVEQKGELMSDSINRQKVIDTEGLDVQIRCEMCRNPMHTDRGCDGNCRYDEKLYERIIQILGERIKSSPSAESVKAYTKADYIMALHKEYGCTLTMAEEAHNKALEYLRSKARMKG